MKKRQIHILFSFIFLFLLGELSLKAQSFNNDYPILEKLGFIKKKVDNFNLYINFRTGLHTYLRSKDIAYDRSHFRVDNFEMGIKGKVNNRIGYHFVQDFNEPAKNISIDGLSRLIQTAYLSYHFNDKLSIKLGKQSLSLGGVDLGRKGIHVYQDPDILEKMNFFDSGINLTYTPLENHEFQFQILNNPIDRLIKSFTYKKEGREVIFEEKDLKKQGITPIGMPLSYTLYWEGNLFNDRVNTKWSYSLFNDAKDKFSGFLALGHLFKIASFNLDFDYMLAHQSVDKFSYGNDFLRVLNMNDSSKEKDLATYLNHHMVSLGLRYGFLSKWNFLLKGTYEFYLYGDLKKIRKDLDNNFRTSYG